MKVKLFILALIVSITVNAQTARTSEKKASWSFSKETEFLPFYEEVKLDSIHSEMHGIIYIDRNATARRILSTYFPKNSDTGFMLSDLLPSMKLKVTKKEFEALMKNPIIIQLIKQILKHYEK